MTEKQERPRHFSIEPSDYPNGHWRLSVGSHWAFSGPVVFLLGTFSAQEVEDLRTLLASVPVSGRAADAESARDEVARLGESCEALTHDVERQRAAIVDLRAERDVAIDRAESAEEARDAAIQRGRELWGWGEVANKDMDELEREIIAAEAERDSLREVAVQARDALVIERYHWRATLRAFRGAETVDIDYGSALATEARLTVAVTYLDEALKEG